MRLFLFNKYALMTNRRKTLKASVVFRVSVLLLTTLPRCRAKVRAGGIRRIGFQAAVRSCLVSSDDRGACGSEHSVTLGKHNTNRYRKADTAIFREHMI